MLKKIVFLLFFCLFRFICIKGQTNLPPAYEIKSDTADQQVVDNAYWQILEDQEGKWTIGQVKKTPLSEKFYTATATIKSFEARVQTYWIRYRLKNVTIREAKITIGSWGMDQLDIYLFPETGKEIHYTTGNEIPWSKRDGFKRYSLVPIVLQPGEEFIIYYRSFNKWRLPPEEVSLLNTEKFINDNYVKNESYYIEEDSIGYNFFSGFFVLAAAYNFLFFLIIRERVYLYFALSLFFTYVPSLISHTIWREHLKMAGYFEQLLYFSLFFFTLFIRHFFQTYRYFPRWDKFMIFATVSIVAIVVCFPYLQTNPFSYSIIEPVFWGIIYPIIILITFFFIVRNPHVSARPFVIALLPLMMFLGISTLAIIFYKILRVPEPAFFIMLEAQLSTISQLCITWLVLYFSWILFKRYDKQRKEIAQQILDKERLTKEKEMERAQLIEQQKNDLEKQVAERTAELKQSLEELKSTQSQLIQSAKMASLGELTAGIAHEIQNPLNFVNNFSEVSHEMFNEMKEELTTGNMQLATEIADNIKQNLEKINHHGKRADAIVKGMLQHSRVGTGAKELTDINKLADEYLRLAYHGMRAKDKSFNAEIKTDFDQSIGSINIVPQDIGRVLLNLFNNSFYAVNEKKQKLDGTFKPVVSVSTKKENGNVAIRVADNGNGVPQNIVDKIFQPFFTTKPTGQGTGLGLSLSYDIIKAHGGEIKVETKEGKGSEFIIQLPV